MSEATETKCCEFVFRARQFLRTEGGWMRTAAVVTVFALQSVAAPLAYSQDKPAEKAPAKAEQKKKDDKSTKEKAAPAAAAPAPARPNYEEAMKNLRWREIGPATMGGRIDDFAVVESNPDTFYVGTASGGVLKTTNGGVTFEVLFENEAVSTIGDITIAPSDPSILWVGTGESNNRQSSSWGNGVYKSTDSGATWKHMGLAETHHIGRIVIHPTNPDILYVAAAGHLWGPNKERGVYKSTDGGKSWTNVLYINEDTGVNDIAMDPESPGTLYAGAYERRRQVFGMMGSGPSSGIYKTTDGGASWKKLDEGLPWDQTPRAVRAQQAANRAGRRGGGGGGGQAGLAALAAQFGFALPEAGQTTGGQPPAAIVPPEKQEIGRIALDIYRKNPNIVYALVEHAQGGIFRSEDKGETWTKMSDTNPRAMYFSQVRIDPNNDQRIWVAGAQMYYSEDGGKTFNTTFVQRVHADSHGIWIDPHDSDHMLVGVDGGVYRSNDRGRTWDHLNTIPLGQFYEVAADMQRPYYICGGLQDNNSWCGPSAVLDATGISNDRWFTVGGGDGFYAQMDPMDANTVYAESQDGNVLRRDLRTHESRSIRPQPEEREKPFRFQWNSPIWISAYDHNTVYYGGNFLFKSTNRGDAWVKLGGDLTTGVDRNSLPIMGKVPDVNTLSRHDGVQQFPCITVIGESPINKDVLWVGTDDGNLQVTRDGGKTWKNVAGKVTGVPKGTYVSRVVASKFGEGTAYATFDGHRMNDYNIYIYTTTDFGETWKAIRNGVPDGAGTLHVIREHPKNQDLLFAGMEFGMYVSFDRGANWNKMKMNLPTVPVDDILIHPRDHDLILGTHGRSIWVLDDIGPLAEMNDKVAMQDFAAFNIRPATLWRTANRTNLGSDGHKNFLGQNPPNGAMIYYFLKSKLAEGERIRITVTDKDGKTVRANVTSTNEPGINRVVWDLRGDAPVPPAPPGQGGGPGGGGGGGGGFGGGGAALGLRVDPGEYTVKITAGKNEATKTVVVEEDPRLTITAADRAAKRDALSKLTPMVRTAVIGQRGIQALRTAVEAARTSWNRTGPGAPAIPDNVKKAAEDFMKKIDEQYPKWAQLPAQGVALGAAGPPLVERLVPIPQRIQQLSGAIEGYSAAPTAWQIEQISILKKALDEMEPGAKKLLEVDLPALNKLMNEAGIPHINVAMPGAGGGRGRPPVEDEEQP